MKKAKRQMQEETEQSNAQVRQSAADWLIHGRRRLFSLAFLWDKLPVLFDEGVPRGASPRVLVAFTRAGDASCDGRPLYGLV